MEFLILWPLAIAAFGLLLIGIGKLGNRIMNGSQSAFMADYTNFMKEAADRGLDYPTAIAHWHVRQAMARLRREASDAVRSDPANWKTILDAKVGEACVKMSLVDPDLLPMFTGMLNGLSYGQILYPEEAKMVDKDVAKLAVLAPTMDQWAALRVVK